MRSGRHSEVTRLRRATNRLVDEGASFSGAERNRLFINHSGSDFSDLSGISGVDSLGDARTNVRLDIDRDGFTDIGIVNANAPFFSLYRNKLGERSEANHFIAIRFKGGNRTSESSTWSARDGYGATVQVKAGSRVLLREHRAGEGFAGQNSRTMLVGIGDNDRASIGIRWPSGLLQEVPAVAAGSLVTVFENPRELADGSRYVVSDYRSRRASFAAESMDVEKLPIEVSSGSQLSVYVTMATWCERCSKELANLEKMMAQLGPGTVTAFGVPIDPADTVPKLEQWKRRHALPIPVLQDLTKPQKETLRKLLKKRTKIDSLVPTTIIADSTGKILDVIPGPPTLSRLREFLDS